MTHHSPEKIQKNTARHMGCNHNSNSCTRKAPDHKNEATKTNKMGGSEAFSE